jgi:citrate lyase alpha subunit
MTALTPFDDHDVTETTIRITRAGDGLSEGLDVEPVELHHGQRVHIVLRGEVVKIASEPTKEGDELRRVHTIRAVFGTLVDESVVRKVLDAQRKAIDKARGLARLPGVDGDEDQGDGAP